MEASAASDEKSNQWLSEAKALHEAEKHGKEVNGDGSSTSAWRLPQREIQMIARYRDGWVPLEDIGKIAGKK